MNRRLRDAVAVAVAMTAPLHRANATGAGPLTLPSPPSDGGEGRVRGPKSPGQSSRHGSTVKHRQHRRRAEETNPKRRPSLHSKFLRYRLLDHPCAGEYDAG